MTRGLDRSQLLVLGFFLLACVALVAILVAAPEVYWRSLRLAGDDRGVAAVAFLVALSVFIGLLAVGVVRRWRWTFWLIVVAFLAGALRIPLAVLQLAGSLEPEGPAWYVAFQGAIGAAQVVIGLLLLRGYRRAGVWGAF